MKYRNLIKLLSVLLCMVMLFTSCDTGENPATEEVTTTETTEITTTSAEQPKEPVEPVLKNFFDMKDAEASTVALKDATRLEGDVVSYSDDGAVVVLRNATLNFENKVTEVFTVYNLMQEKTVLSFTNTYSYGTKPFDGWPESNQFGWMPGYDWSDTLIYDDNNPYQESTLAVSVESGYMLDYWIMLKKATLTPIDEEIREENEDGCAYDVQIVYEYYDVTGQKITESKKELFWMPIFISDSFTEMGYIVGDMKVFFDPETKAMTRCIAGDDQKIVVSYDRETEKYGYYFGEQEAAMGTISEYVEVYDKSSGERLFRYYFEAANYSLVSYVLENGDILIQTWNNVDDDAIEAYDFIDRSGSKIVLKTYILDVETQKLTEIDCDFVILTLMTLREWKSREYFLEDVPVTLTENVLNVAVVEEIHNKQPENPVIVCLDNETNVMFKLEPIVPEHMVTNAYGSIDFGFEILPSGDYLVDLYNVVTPRAIVSKDGKVRSYLKDSDYIAGDFVVNEVGIFDYDGKELYAFNEENEWILACVFADNIIVSRQEEVYAEGADPDVDEPEEIVTKYYTLTKSGNTFHATQRFQDQTVINIDAEDHYLIAQTAEDGNEKYSIYNADIEHVLTTANPVSVFEVDGKYAAMTVVEGTNLYYVLK